MSIDYDKARADIECEKTRKYLLEKGIITDKTKKDVRKWKCFYCQTFEGSNEEVVNHQMECMKIKNTQDEI